MKTESVPPPKWLCTNMFAHSVVSWTVEFELYLAFQPSTRWLAMDFLCFCRLLLNYTYLTCWNFVCQHLVMVKRRLKPRAFAFIMSDFQHVLGNLALFLAQVNIRLMPCRDSTRLCSTCGEVGTRSISTVSPAPLISCHWVLRSHRQGTSVCHFKSVPTWWLCGPISACTTG